jgi:hypothetical protein
LQGSPRKRWIIGVGRIENDQEVAAPRETESKNTAVVPENPNKNERQGMRRKRDKNTEPSFGRNLST